MIIGKKNAKKQLQSGTFHQKIQNTTFQKFCNIWPRSSLPLGLTFGIQQHFQKTESKLCYKYLARLMSKPKHYMYYEFARQEQKL